MSGFIKAKRAKGIDKPSDNVGGFGPRPSGVYAGTVKLAYGQSSESSEAQAMNVEIELDAGGKVFGRHWFSGTDGQVYSVDEKTGKKKFKAGYLLADALALLATDGEADLFNLDTEPKTIKQKRDGKEVNVKVESFYELEGLKVQVAIIATEKYKQNYVDGDYIETDEIITTSEIHTYFDEEGFTIAEIEEELDEPVFIETFKKAWVGKTRTVAKKEERKSLRKSTSEDGGAKSRVAQRKSLIKRK